MGELSIKIKIGDREYPMRVNPSEEERLRLAGRILNEKLKSFRDSFGIDDKQDLLAMVAFDCMAEKIKSETEINDLGASFFAKLSSIETQITGALSE